MKKAVFFAALVLFAVPAFSIYLVDLQKDIISHAEKQKGVPYVYAGTSPKGFDCSGFIFYLFKDFVPGVPRSSRGLGVYGETLDKDEFRPGDLLFFATGKDPHQISHVALYIGQNSMIHAASAGPRTGIIITDIEERYWKSRFHSARRISFPTDAEIALSQNGEFYKIEFARGTYEGEMTEGEPEGRGVFTLKTGDLYQGQFKAGLFHGKGTYTWKDKSTYKGSFSQGKFNGLGTITYASGNTYSGDWKNDRIEGEGGYTWASGAKYEGGFYNFQETGGWYTSPNGQKAWAKTVEGTLKFFTDETALTSVLIQGPKLVSAKAIATKNLNGFSKPNSEWDNYVAPEFPEDWER